MKAIFRSWFRSRQSRIRRRLDKTHDTATYRPVLSGRPIDYDVAHRHRAIAHGGIGAIHMLAHQLGLPRAIDQRLHLLKVHLPYHESDHVLNIAYDPLCHGTCLQDIELRRNDEGFLDALGTRRIPDPTTAGDFCRRFTPSHIDTLQNAIDVARRNVWSKQPASFFDRATIDMDGTLVPTTGSCKAGMDIAHDGTWGYHPLVVSLAETGEVLRLSALCAIFSHAELRFSRGFRGCAGFRAGQRDPGNGHYWGRPPFPPGFSDSACEEIAQSAGLLNRPGNRPSHEGAAGQVDRAIWLCLQAGFRRIVLRGDTDFSQTQHLDRWHALPGVYFVFGYDARPNFSPNAPNAYRQRPGSRWRVRPGTRCRRNPGGVPMW